jgi:hypothetical protein
MSVIAYTCAIVSFLVFSRYYPIPLLRKTMENGNLKSVTMHIRIWYLLSSVTKGMGEDCVLPILLSRMEEHL